MSARAASAPGAGVLDRLQVLRSAPTPLRGALAATWTPSPRTGVGPLRVPGPGLQPSSHDTTTTRTDPAGSTLATPDFGPKDGVHLNVTTDLQLRFAKTITTGGVRTLVFMNASNIFNDLQVNTRNRFFGGGQVLNDDFFRPTLINSGRALSFGLQTSF